MNNESCVRSEFAKVGKRRAQVLLFLFVFCYLIYFYIFSKFYNFFSLIAQHATYSRFLHSIIFYLVLAYAFCRRNILLYKNPFFSLSWPLGQQIFGVYSLGVLAHFPPWGILELGYYHISGSKNQTKKLIKSIKLLSYIKFLHKIFVANCNNIPNVYSIHKKN